MAEDFAPPVLSGGRRKTIGRISKHLKEEMSKLQHKISDKSRRSEGDSWKKRDREKVMKYLWKDIKQQNTNKLQAVLNSDGMNLPEIDPTGSLLMYAAKHLMKQEVHILLVNGSPVCCDKSTGLSPFHMAVKMGSSSLLSIMISNKVDVHEVTLYEKKTSLHISARHNRLDATQILLENVIGPNIQDIYGSTAMHYAVCTENIKLVELLIEKKADINKCDNEGWTPLHHAVAACDSQMVNFLLQHKANITAQTKYGKTALHLACTKHNLNMADVLLQHAAPTDTPDCHGKKAGQYTQDQNIISLLEYFSEDNEQDHQVTHITLQIKSRSLIDLLDPEFVNDEYYSQNYSSLPSIVTPPKLSFGSLVKLIMKAKQKRSSLNAFNIRARLESAGFDIHSKDKRCYSIESIQSILDLEFDPDLYLNTMDIIEEDVFEEEDTFDMKTSNKTVHFGPKYSCSLKIDHMNDVSNSDESNHDNDNNNDYNSGSNNCVKGEIKSNDSFLVCSIHTALFDNIDECLVNISEVMNQLEEIKEASTSDKKDERIDELTQYLRIWKKSSENFKQQLVRKF